MHTPKLYPMPHWKICLKYKSRASLVVQWLKIHFAMHWTPIWSLVWEVMSESNVLKSVRNSYNVELYIQVKSCEM